MTENKITVDFSEPVGRVKPMHAVNNGPVYKFAADQRITNINEYREAGIPYARTHDANLFSTYGGPHTVDIYAVFPNFDADACDPASYDFVCTDEYLKSIDAAGTKIFYRLGVSIEHHAKKHHTAPPNDYLKWAKICEHIIRHYTEGWADGFFYDIKYWEIWNEPENGACTWDAPREDFAEFFGIAHKYLKTTFPHLKIGGPATTGPWFDGTTESYLTASGLPLDFYSWHLYASDPKEYVLNAQKIRKKLEALGMHETESILDEWNYVLGWFGEKWERSLLTERSLKGSAFIAASICDCQYAPVDMLMYYDARPCGMNGMFEAYTMKPLKGYTPFHMFNRLYKLGTALRVENCEDIHTAAARNDEGEGAVMFAHYNNNDQTLGKTVTLEVKNAVIGKRGVKAEYFMLDAYRTETPVKEEIHESSTFEDEIFMPIHSTCLVRITPV